MDLIHIEGKPYALLPMHEYRRLVSRNNDADGNIPQEILDQIIAGQDHPLKILRNWRGQTQKELAESSGLSRPYLAEIEAGHKPGSLAAMKTLSAALDVPLELLLT
jgi:DNA-binding XRE family transcriptional regulator